MTITSPISIKVKENEKFSASLNIEISEKEVSPVIKNDNETVSTSVKDDKVTNTSPINIKVKENEEELAQVSLHGGWTSVNFRKISSEFINNLHVT